MTQVLCAEHRDWNVSAIRNPRIELSIALCFPAGSLCLPSSSTKNIFDFVKITLLHYADTEQFKNNEFPASGVYTCCLDWGGDFFSFKN